LTKTFFGNLVLMCSWGSLMGNGKIFAGNPQTPPMLSSPLMDWKALPHFSLKASGVIIYFKLADLAVGLLFDYKPKLVKPSRARAPRFGEETRKRLTGMSADHEFFSLTASAFSSPIMVTSRAWRQGNW